MQVNEQSKGFINQIDGHKFKEMLFSALLWLKEQQALIDSLNVFPVPDGDTGTNMYLTFLEAVKEVKKNESNNVSEINSALAKGALMGARGNSGVILSQLLRGFHLANKNNKNFSRKNFVDSLKKASEVAYQGVLKPVEGTILTVSRKAAEGAEEAFNNKLDLVGIIKNTIAATLNALNKTPEQLPALKEAKVVDAGGQGYLTILEGMLKGLSGEKTFKYTELELVKPKKRRNIQTELKYAYCTQLLIELKKEKSINQIRSDIEGYGDSILVVGTENVVKIHIHSNHPGLVLEYGLKLGSVNDITIDNMRLQSEEKIKKEEEKQRKEFTASQEIGIIAVGQGEGIKKILSDMGVNIIIDGGQSMNPSTNDFLKAIESIESLEIIILPNNKNVISAARQAASLSDKKIEVVPTRSFPQAINSLLVFNHEADLQELQETMEAEMNKVRTAEITTAIKDSKVNGIKINTGDIIGLYENDIKVTGNSYQEVVSKLLKAIVKGEELLTIYYGADVTEEDALELQKALNEGFDFDEIEIYNGGQPLYPYIISLE
ncbi:MAG: DAK2 domain-containing protein [Halanaerobiales bacterium]|nr:DAK2 domain-containing protein [Halanaerobiales bacterium]